MGVGIKIPKKKKPIARRVSNKGGEPEYTGSAELSGEAYGRLRRSAADFYRMEFKPSDFKLWVLAWAKESDKWKDKLEVLKKLPDYEFRSSIGGSCRMLSKGIVDVHPGFNEYWAGLAGTMGEVKPLTDFINTHLVKMYERGQVIAEASKKIETQKKTMKPTTEKNRRQQQVQRQQVQRPHRPLQHHRHCHRKTTMKTQQHATRKRTTMMV